MRRDAGGVRLSAQDLMRFTACPHATHLDMAWLEGDDELVPVEDSELNVLLQQHGIRHEADYLSRLEAEGRHVVRIETENASFEEAVEATREALHAGPDIIFQGAFQGGMWGGYADFLERVAEPSRLGAFSYEVADTKLKHNPVPGHLLQLVLYSDLLTEVQGRAPGACVRRTRHGQTRGFPALAVFRLFAPRSQATRGVSYRIRKQPARFPVRTVGYAVGANVAARSGGRMTAFS